MLCRQVYLPCGRVSDADHRARCARSTGRHGAAAIPIHRQAQEREFFSIVLSFFDGYCNFRSGWIDSDWILQDEKNPSARWCPRAGCEELIICDSNVNFTCPKCKAVGCFQCRGFAHRFWFCRAQVDPSYAAWEKSVGQWNAVRGCPRCSMRIWKSEGCNHMTCTHCRHQYCWVCGSNWEPRYDRSVLL